jgi:hypothetical protein
VNDACDPSASPPRARRRADGAAGRGGELAGGTLLDLAHALGTEPHALADRAQPL